MRLTAALFIAAFALGMAGGVRHGVCPSRDGEAYHVLALSILRGEYSLGDVPTARYEPLHPAFLAACHALGGLPACLVGGSLAAAGAMGLWFLAARRWFGEGSRLPHALWALWLWPNRLYLDARICRREPILCLLTGAMAWALTRAWETGRRRHAVLAGLVWGLACLTKSAWLMLAPALLVVACRRGKLRMAAWASAVCLAVIAPWSFRNLHAVGTPMLSTLGGVNFLENRMHGMDPWRPHGIAPAAGFVLREAAADRELYRAKLAAIAREPLLAVRIVGFNLLQFLYPLEGVYPRSPGEPARLHPALLFAWAGIAMAIRRWRLPPAAVAMLAAWLGVCLLWQALGTYRLPVEPILIAWGLAGWARSGLRRSGVTYAACWAVSWLLKRA